MMRLFDALGEPDKRGVRGAVCIQRDGKLLPPNVYFHYPTAKAEADKLTTETGIKHEAVLVLDFSGAKR